MARGKSLLHLLQQYRSEVRASDNPAHNAGVRDGQVRLLQRTQEWLYDEYDWAFLRVERFTELQNGQRFYDTPADIEIDRLEKIDVRYGSDWVPLGFGVEDDCYAVYDSYVDQRGWPVQRWKIHEDEQIEIWPIPGANSSRYDDPAATDREGQLRMTGIRKLRPLVADDDVADLDDRLIVLYAASETLAAKDSKDAGLKAQAAAKRFKALTGNMTKVKTFGLFGVTDREPKPRRPPIPTVHYRTSS